RSDFTGGAEPRAEGGRGGEAARRRGREALVRQGAVTRSRRRSKRSPGPEARASLVAEGVGFEPTVACATMVFETIRFGRSRIPPGRSNMLRDTSNCTLRPLHDAGRQSRRTAKNARRSAADSSPRTPATTCVVWLRRGSAAKL